MIKLLDIIPIRKEDLAKYKLHLASSPRDKREPYYELLKDLKERDQKIKYFKSWQELQNIESFNRDFIFSLVYFNPDEWIFAGIYKCEGPKREGSYFKYDTELLDLGKDLIGRLVIHFKRHGRQPYRNLEKWADKMEVLEITRKRYPVDEFPGYENVLIEFNCLKSIIEIEEPSWKTALSSVKGVYIITDRNTGKVYIGSAYGENSFWSRWSQYIKNGHGGNKELEAIIREKGLEYASNFQFAILEVTFKITDNEIMKRETHWKKVLKSREFGYNEN